MKEDGKYYQEAEELILITGTIPKKTKLYPKLKLKMGYKNSEMISINEVLLPEKSNFLQNLTKYYSKHLIRMLLEDKD